MSGAIISLLACTGISILHLNWSYDYLLSKYRDMKYRNVKCFAELGRQRTAFRLLTTVHLAIVSMDRKCNTVDELVR
jgi:hypothetical protein